MGRGVLLPFNKSAETNSGVGINLLVSGRWRGGAWCIPRLGLSYMTCSDLPITKVSFSFLQILKFSVAVLHEGYVLVYSSSPCHLMLSFLKFEDCPLSSDIFCCHLISSVVIRYQGCVLVPVRFPVSSGAKMKEYRLHHHIRTWYLIILIWCSPLHFLDLYTTTRVLQCIVLQFLKSSVKLSGPLFTHNNVTLLKELYLN